MKTQIEEVVVYDDAVIDGLANEATAIEQSFFCRTPKSRSLRYCAELIEMNAGHLTKVVQGLAGMPVNRSVAFMRAMGNVIWLQYIARQFGLVLVPEDKYQQLLVEQDRSRHRQPMIKWNVRDFSTPR